MAEPIIYDYSGAMEDVELSAGKYLLECYGAQGGGLEGGNGGYAAGEIEFSEDITLHLFVGEKPTGLAGGWNGGGDGNAQYEYSSQRGGGGGTDIRINGTTYADRLIVAGGGGGSGASAPFAAGLGGDSTDSTQVGDGWDGTRQGTGGGGGGYRGGYAGSWYNDPGSGGSSYVGTLANASTTSGVRDGDGLIKITKLTDGSTQSPFSFAQII